MSHFPFFFSERKKTFSYFYSKDIARNSQKKY